jgi:hypothetical protein
MKFSVMCTSVSVVGLSSEYVMLCCVAGALSGTGVLQVSTNTPVYLNAFC